jgi:hypothetical protein
MKFIFKKFPSKFDCAFTSFYNMTRTEKYSVVKNILSARQRESGWVETEWPQSDMSYQKRGLSDSRLV